MSLIAIILSLIAERFLGSMEEVRRFGWFRRYSAWLFSRLSGYSWLNGPAGVLLLLLFPLAAVALADFYLNRWWIVLGLAFAVLVLLFSFGPADLEAEVEAYLDAQERGDEESAQWHAAELLGAEPTAGGDQLTRRIIESTLVEANDRLLAVLFWFLLLGPVGAVMYRLSSQLVHQGDVRHESLAEAALRLHALLAWPPARMCALAYALAGSFVHALQAWRAQEGSWHETSREVLIASGLGALGYQAGDESSPNETGTEMVHETLALVRRAVLVFLSAMALFTLAGWLS